MSIIVSNCQHCKEQRTISNTVIFTLPIFSVVKSNFFIRALLLDRILVREKTTRTLRVHLVCSALTVLYTHPSDTNRDQY